MPTKIEPKRFIAIDFRTEKPDPILTPWQRLEGLKAAQKCLDIGMSPDDAEQAAHCVAFGNWLANRPKTARLHVRERDRCPTVRRYARTQEQAFRSRAPISEPGPDYLDSPALVAATLAVGVFIAVSLIYGIGKLAETLWLWIQ